MPTILPARHQRVLPLDQFILKDPPSAEAVEMDVLIVGAGPAGLAGAIELARLGKDGGTELNIGVLEKAGSLGEHNLSGAVVNPRAFRELFPDLSPADFPFRQPVPGEAVYFLTESRAQRIPTPPTMHNPGYYTASICEIVRWLGERAEGLGVNLFTGFPGGRAARRGRRGPRRAHDADRPRAGRASRAPASPRPPTSPRASPSSPKARAATSPRPTASGRASARRIPRSSRSASRKCGRRRSRSTP